MPKGSSNQRSKQTTTAKIILIGDSGSGVGKTAILSRYVQNKFTSQYKATIGADFLSKMVNGTHFDLNINLQMWDTAGRERFASLGNAFYRGADAALLVYDVKQKKTFESLKLWKEGLEQILGTGAEKCVMVLVANKVEDGVDRQVSTKEGKELATFWNMLYYEVSAKEGTGIHEMFASIIERLETPLFKQQQQLHTSLTANSNASLLRKFCSWLGV